MHMSRRCGRWCTVHSTTAGVHSDQLDAVAATRGPGLAGALMVGFSFGKALAWSLQKPFLGIDHMEGHLFAPLLDHPAYGPPAVVLLASGGHSQIVHVVDWGRYEVMGGTIDDAAGEAFDKLARFMGLGYPGGPAIDLASAGGDPTAVRFPRALQDRPYDLSFSGLKTSVVTFLENGQGERNGAAARRCGRLAPRGHRRRARRQDVQRSRRNRRRRPLREVVVCSPIGGSVNGWQRKRIDEGVALYLPSPALCTDNGAMIASAGVFRLGRGDVTSLPTDIDPGLRLA